MAQTLFGGGNQGVVRGNISILDFSSVLRKIALSWEFFGLLGFGFGFFFKLVREEPELLRKRLYFLAVIVTLLSWKGTKI